jgi:hypothetical protein
MKGHFICGMQRLKRNRKRQRKRLHVLNSEAENANSEWRNTLAWQQLRLEELAAARIQRTAEKNGAPKKITTQSWRSKKFKVES